MTNAEYLSVRIVMVSEPSGSGPRAPRPGPSGAVPQPLAILYILVCLCISEIYLDNIFGYMFAIILVCVWCTFGIKWLFFFVDGWYILGTIPRSGSSIEASR